MDLAEKIKRCLERHPDWPNSRIAKSTGARHDAIEAVRRGEQPPPGEPVVPLQISPENAAEIRGRVKAWRGQHQQAPPASVSLAAVRERFDIAASIRRTIAGIQRGTLLPEDELCRLTAGRDRSRFRRAIENNPDLARAHRVRLRLDDSTDGKFFWGHEIDIAEAVRLRDM